MPKTHSSGLFREAVAKIAEGKRWVMPAKINHSIILCEIATASKSIGYTAAQKN